DGQPDVRPVPRPRTTGLERAGPGQGEGHASWSPGRPAHGDTRKGLGLSLARGSPFPWRSLPRKGRRPPRRLVARHAPVRLWRHPHVPPIPGAGRDPDLGTTRSRRAGADPSVHEGSGRRRLGGRGPAHGGPVVAGRPPTRVLAVRPGGPGPGTRRLPAGGPGLAVRPGPRPGRPRAAHPAL